MNDNNDAVFDYLMMHAPPDTIHLNERSATVAVNGVPLALDAFTLGLKRSKDLQHEMTLNWHGNREFAAFQLGSFHEFVITITAHPEWYHHQEFIATNCAQEMPFEGILVTRYQLLGAYLIAGHDLFRNREFLRAYITGGIT